MQWGRKFAGIRYAVALRRAQSSTHNLELFLLLFEVVCEIDLLEIHHEL